MYWSFVELSAVKARTAPGQRVVADGEPQCPLLLRSLSLAVTPETTACSIHLPVARDVSLPVRSVDLRCPLLSCT